MHGGASKKTVRPDAGSAVDPIAHITAALSGGRSTEVAAAIGELLRARGVADVAKRAGIRRESLYKTFSASGNPELTTLLSVLTSVGLGLKVYRLSLEQTHLARLGPSRLRQLRADLALSPEHRVRAASLTAAAVPRGKRRPPKALGFAEFEDFLTWKERQRIPG